MKSVRGRKRRRRRRRRRRRSEKGASTLAPEVTKEREGNGMA